MRKTTITCDECGKDIALSEAGYDEWTYQLKVGLIPNEDGSRMVYSNGTSMSPADLRAGEFCSVDCLCQWIDSERARSAKLGAWRKPAKQLILDADVR